MEDANSGDSCCAGVEAHLGSAKGDSAEGKDGDGIRGAAGFAEASKAHGGGDGLSSDDFSEDRGKDDGVGGGCAGVTDLVDAVAGDGDDGVRQACGGVATAYLSLGDGSVVGADVDTRGAGGDGGLDGGVDEKNGARRRDDLHDPACDGG